LEPQKYWEFVRLSRYPLEAALVRLAISVAALVVSLRIRFRAAALAPA
jgi:hypothetical protein